MASVGNFGAMKVASVHCDENKPYEGRLVGTILCGGNLTEAQMRDWL